MPGSKFAAVGLAVHRDDGSWFGTAAVLLLLLSAMLFLITVFVTLFKFWRRPIGGSKVGQYTGWGFWVFDRSDLTWAIQSQRIVEAGACKEQMNSNCNVREVQEQLILSILKRELLVETSTAQDRMKMWLQATNRILICTSQPSLKGRGSGVFNCYNSVRHRIMIYFSLLAGSFHKYI